MRIATAERCAAPALPCDTPGGAARGASASGHVEGRRTFIRRSTFDRRCQQGFQSAWAFVLPSPLSSSAPRGVMTTLHAQGMPATAAAAGSARGARRAAVPGTPPPLRLGAPRQPGAAALRVRAPRAARAAATHRAVCAAEGGKVVGLGVCAAEEKRILGLCLLRARALSIHPRPRADLGTTNSAIAAMEGGKARARCSLCRFSQR